MMKSPVQSPKKAPTSHDSTPTQSPNPKPRPNEQWLDEASMKDVDHFAKTVSAIKSKTGSSSRPDLLASVLSHYASKWLPELSSTSSGRFYAPPPPPESPTAAWLKKRLFVESLIAALPPEMNNKDMESAINCDFLLRLLRAGLMVGADQASLRELEARVGRRLEQASLSEVMIPAFGHTSGTLLDVSLVMRLVKGFLAAEERVSGAAMARVAKLVDAYLAEVALEAGLGVKEFEELARALPAHARATDDGLYRAMDTFLKAHPNTTKEERKTLCRLIDVRKLTSEASAHAIQNERLPVRSVMQVLFSEHTKLNRLTDWSGSFTGPRSPNPAQLDLSGRCPSKREALAHQQEIRRLREDVARLQVQCHALQAHVDRLMSDRRKKGTFFRWSTFFFGGADVAKVEDSETRAERQTPSNSKKGRPIPPPTTHGSSTATPTKWRKSLS
ncbi:Phototropic-responsive NPH3 family protein [Rhynchospora pubera]|uniref:Phototropic-responsive NPH3 family protein n=1 Tax=Rhynchospora pubera TaxID=906938 RepID=A0AAV8DA36_9POAL|nr:Phototropic-responsive NPH3 family protein [Rhynchospora pubera]